MHLRLLYKKFLCVFMSLMIVIFSTQSAYATTSVGGWTATDSLIAGANTTINAAKTAGGKALKSSITVAASASKVGKYLIKGGGSAALAFAMVELADGAIDWVLDPANNRVIVTRPVDAGGVGSDGSLLWGPTSDKATFANPAAACRSLIPVGYHSYRILPDGVRAVCVWTTPDGIVQDKVLIHSRKNPAYNPDAPVDDGKSYIPIDTVAAKVISNAEAGHAPSQEAVKATALEGFAAGEHDAALDAAATETGTENPPKDGEAVPFDPSSILAALSSISAILAGIMSALTGFVDWWQAQWATFSTGITEFFQWVRAEPDVESLKPEPVEVSEGTLVDGWQDKANAGYVNMGNTQCPADVLIPISYMGASTNLSLSYVPFCHFASIIRYAVILGAWVAALMIISGGRTKE